MIKLHTHTHTHTHNCYRQKLAEFYTNFVKNVNNRNIKKVYINLVKGDEFLQLGFVCLSEFFSVIKKIEKCNTNEIIDVTLNNSKVETAIQTKRNKFPMTRKK